MSEESVVAPATPPRGPGEKEMDGTGSASPRGVLQQDLPASVLLPCPFCGDTAILEGLGNRAAGLDRNVICSNCNVLTLDYPTDEEAIAAWNRRAEPKAAWSEMRNTTLAKLWLWKNGDHYWAFDNLYPCVPADGDPLTLGEPVGYALLKPSVPRREAEGDRCETTEAKPSTSPSPKDNASRDDVLEEAAKEVQTLLDDLCRKVKLIDSAYLHGAHHYVGQVLTTIRALKEKPHG